MFIELITEKSPDNWIGDDGAALTYGFEYNAYLKFYLGAVTCSYYGRDTDPGNAEENNTYYRQGSQTVREGGATSRQYDIIEAYVRHEAKIRGLEAREVSAMIWSGIRGGVTRYDLILRHQNFNMYESTR